MPRGRSDFPENQKTKIRVELLDCSTFLRRKVEYVGWWIVATLRSALHTEYAQLRAPRRQLYQYPFCLPIWAESSPCWRRVSKWLCFVLRNDHEAVTYVRAHARTTKCWIFWKSINRRRLAILHDVGKKDSLLVGALLPLVLRRRMSISVSDLEAPERAKVRKGHRFLQPQLIEDGLNRRHDLYTKEWSE